MQSLKLCYFYIFSKYVETQLLCHLGNSAPEEFTVLQRIVSTQTHDHVNQHLTYAIPQHSSTTIITSFDHIN